MGTQLKKLTMYSKVKDLFENGLTISQINRITELDRKTVRCYLKMSPVEFKTFLEEQERRHRKLAPYEPFIRKRIENFPSCSV